MVEHHPVDMKDLNSRDSPQQVEKHPKKANSAPLGAHQRNPQKEVENAGNILDYSRQVVL
jgi:hypothetical protein